MKAHLKGHSPGSARTHRPLPPWQTSCGVAELGYLETQSSGLLQSTLAEAGFEISTGIGGIPTALPPLRQQCPGDWHYGRVRRLARYFSAAVPYVETVEGKPSGHACGHNPLARAACAAIAVKDWLEAFKQPGTVRFYGTPAEEAARARSTWLGFDDVDAALHWHPGDDNTASSSSTLNKSAKFRFSGFPPTQRPVLSASPALDAIEAMNFMVNLLREHGPKRPASIM